MYIKLYQKEFFNLLQDLTVYIPLRFTSIATVN